MSHRNPLKELFGLVCLAVFFPKSEKSPIPSGARTGYIIATEDAIKYENPRAVTVGRVTTPQATGFLPFLLSLLPLFGEEVLGIVASYLLFNGLLLLMRITKRFTTGACLSLYRRIRGPAAPESATEVDASHKMRQLSDEIDETSLPPNDSETIHSPPEDHPDNEPLPPTNDQTVADLRAQSADKDATIAALSKDAKNKSNIAAYLERRNDSLIGRLRGTLDPSSLYPPNTDIVTMTTDIARDYKRVSKKIDRQRKELEEARRRQENGQLAEKDQEITQLSATIITLRGQIGRLETGQLSSVQQAEENERKAKDREVRFRDRTLEAERIAREAISQRDYNILRDQLEVVIGRLREATGGKEAAMDAQASLRSALEAKMAQDAETKGRAAEEKVRAAEEKVRAAEEKTQAAEEKTRAADEKTRAADEKVAEHAAAVKEAQNSLQEARDSAKESDESNKELQQKLERAEEASKKESEASTEDVKLHHHEDLLAQIQSLNKQLHEAEKKETGAFENGYLKAVADNPPADQSISDNAARPSQQDASVQTVESQNDDLYGRGYQKAFEECSAQVPVLIENAIRQEALQAQQRQNNAVIQTEQAVRASVEGAWRNREESVMARFNAAVDSAASERVNTLNIKCNNETLRAVKAIDKLQDLEDKYGEQWQRATEEQERANNEQERAKKAEEKIAVESNRARVAEAELQKYKAGIPPNAQPNAAESEALENDRKRAAAIIDEFLHRHYEFTARIVLEQIVKANTKIDALKTMLKHPFANPSQIQLLTALLDAEVNEKNILQLDPINRQVLLKQSKAVNAKLAVLKTMINASEELNTLKLLEELYKPRGDEDATWCDDDPPSEPSSDEDEDDIKIKPLAQRIREIRVPALRHLRPEPPPPVPVLDTPLSSSPSIHKETKRKGSPEHTKEIASLKRRNERDVDMRPLATTSSHFPHQGLLPPEATSHPIETRRESQDEMPWSERIGEASAPRQHNNDQLGVSAQLPGISSSAERPTAFSLTIPKDTAPAVINPTPAPPNYKPIFRGLSLLGAAMADKQSMTDKKAPLPGLPPLEEDTILEFESSAAAEDRDSTGELDDGFLAHNSSEDEDDEEAIWENALYPPDEDENLIINFARHSYTDDDNDRRPKSHQNLSWLDEVKSLDMTEQNYEEQDAEAAATAASQGTQQAQPKKDSQPPNSNEEELEDTFHIDLD